MIYIHGVFQSINTRIDLTHYSCSSFFFVKFKPENPILYIKQTCERSQMQSRRRNPFKIHSLPPNRSCIGKEGTGHVGNN